MFAILSKIRPDEINQRFSGYTLENENMKTKCY